MSLYDEWKNRHKPKQLDKIRFGNESEKKHKKLDHFIDVKMNLYDEWKSRHRTLE